MKGDYKITITLSEHEAKRLSAMSTGYNLSFEQIMMIGVRQLEEWDNMAEAMEGRR